MPTEKEFELKLKVDEINMTSVIKESSGRKEILQGYLDLRILNIYLKKGFILISSLKKKVKIKIPEDMLVDFEEIFQNGIINREMRPTVRLRTTKTDENGDSYEFTIKVNINEEDKNISSRLEFNIPIENKVIAMSIYDMSGINFIEKVRFIMPSNINNVFWEIDIYKGRNKGLVTAEVEVKDPSDPIPETKKDWIFSNVTEQYELTNDGLSINPFDTLNMKHAELIF